MSLVPPHPAWGLVVGIAVCRATLSRQTVLSSRVCPWTGTLCMPSSVRRVFLSTVTLSGWVLQLRRPSLRSLQSSERSWRVSPRSAGFPDPRLRHQTRGVGEVRCLYCWSVPPVELCSGGLFCTSLRGVDRLETELIPSDVTLCVLAKLTLCVWPWGIVALCARLTSRLATRSPVLCMSPFKVVSIVRTWVSNGLGAGGLGSGMNDLASSSASVMSRLSCSIREGLALNVSIASWNLKSRNRSSAEKVAV